MPARQGLTAENYRSVSEDEFYRQLEGPTRVGAARRGRTRGGLLDGRWQRELHLHGEMKSNPEKGFNETETDASIPDEPDCAIRATPGTEKNTDIVRYRAPWGGARSTRTVLSEGEDEAFSHGGSDRMHADIWKEIRMVTKRRTASGVRRLLHGRIADGGAGVCGYGGGRDPDGDSPLSRERGPTGFYFQVKGKEAAGRRPSWSTVCFRYRVSGHWPDWPG